MIMPTYEEVQELWDAALNTLGAMEEHMGTLDALISIWMKGYREEK
jgi:hypothetical protein